MKKFTPESPDSILGVTFIWPTKPVEDDIAIYIGDNVTFRPPCIVYWGCRIDDNAAISHNTILRERTLIGKNSKIGNGTTLDGNLTIGNNVSVHTLCFIPTKTIIEDYVFIGPNCTITNTKNITHGRNFPLLEERAIIHFGARIGGGTTILPGIHIGKEVLIGAGSVVTRNVPDYKVAYGNPAQIIRDVPLNERFHDSPDL